MNKKRLIALCLIVMLFANTIISVFAETYDYQVGITVSRTLNKTEMVLDNVTSSNNDVEITYTLSFDDINVSSIPVSTPPKEVVLIIDKSGSMDWDLEGNKDHHNETRMSIAKTAASDFVENLSKNANIKLSVISYDTRASVYSLSGNALIDISNGHANKNTIINHIQNIDAYGSTNIGDAIRRGYETLRTGDDNADKFLVFLTDGEPTVYSRNEDNYEYYTGTGTAPKTYFNYSYAKGYAVAMTERLDVFTKNYFVAFSDNGANKLKEISETISSYYKKALTADEIKDVYADISFEISADLNITDVVLKDAIPSGLTVVDKPDAMVVDGQNMTMPIGSVPYVLNASRTKYVAEDVVVTLTLNANAPNEYVFAESNGATISYVDLDGVKRSKTLSSDTLSVTRDPVKNVQASRVVGENGNKVNDVDITWDVYEGATSYNVYKVVEGVDVLMENVSTNAVSLPIVASDRESTVYKVEAVLTDSQVSGKGDIDTDTTSSILNLTASRVNDEFDLRWTPVDGATTYTVKPVLKGVDQPIITITTPQYKGGKVTYEYTLDSASLTFDNDDTLKFVVDALKNTDEVNEATSKEFLIKQLVLTTISNDDLSEFNYTTNKDVHISYVSSDDYPDGVSIYDPLLVLELNLPSIETTTPLEYTYSTLEVFKGSDKVNATIVHTDGSNMKIYVDLTGYDETGLPENETINVITNFAIGYESDDGELTPAIYSALKGEMPGLETFTIQNNIEDLLKAFYVGETYSSIETLLEVKSYVMYNTTNKDVADTFDRDAVTGVSSDYVQMKDVTDILDEF